MTENGIFSFDQEVPDIENFKYSAEAVGPENGLHNNRVRPDGVTLFDYVSDVDLSKEYTSDGHNIGEALGNWLKG